MNAEAAIAAAPASRRALDFLALTKPRVVAMVLVTAAVGFFLGSPAEVDYRRLMATIAGTGLAAAGALALNQYMERALDARMERTRERPLPDGRLRPGEALAFGTLLAVMGIGYLSLSVNALSGAVTAATAVIYLFVYTPLKSRTPLCSVVGAVSGALPPVTGWVGARGDLGVESAVLLAILFLWQMPHTLAIGWLHRDDYARGGMHLLPVIEPDGLSTGRLVVANCCALLVVSLMPTLLGLAGTVYFAAALILGVGLLGAGTQLAWSRTSLAARRLLVVTLVYLPALLLALAVDRVPS